MERQPRRIFLTTPGFETALRTELSRWQSPAPGVGSTEEPAGVVIARDTTPEGASLDPVFGRQQLPHAVEIRATSIAALADGVFGVADPQVDLARGPFTIHAFAPTGAAPGLGSRAALIAHETLGRLRERRRRAARLYLQPDDAAASFGALAVVVQILLVDRDRVWASAATPRWLPRGGWDVAPWPGGVAPVAEDRRPPSRAYRKLEEAFLWLGAEPRPGELCVDLGGAPGGWSYTALRRGARVIAVDRAPLARSILDDPRVTMIEGNAFTYEPPASQTPVDWLLADVICEPTRALVLIDRWVTRGWCHKLIVTVKFKGQNGYGMLADVRAVLEREGCPRLRIKHLHHNKNEVTVMAFCASGPKPSKPCKP